MNQVSPGSLVSLFASGVGVAQNLSASSLPLPKSLGGVSLTVGGSLAFDTKAGVVELLSHWIAYSRAAVRRTEPDQFADPAGRTNRTCCAGSTHEIRWYNADHHPNITAAAPGSSQCFRTAADKQLY